LFLEAIMNGLTPSGIPVSHLQTLPNQKLEGTAEDGIEPYLEESLRLFVGYEPHVVLSRQVFMSSSGMLLRDARVEFWLDAPAFGPNKRRKILCTHIRPSNQASQKATLTINYQSALVAGCDNLDSGWPPEIIAALDELSQLREDGIVAVDLPHSTPEYCEELVKVCQTYEKRARDNTEPRQPNLRPLFLPCQDHLEGLSSDYSRNLLLQTGYQPIRDWSSMNNLHRKKLPLGKPHAVNAFPNLITAESKLIHARYLDQIWEEKMFNLLNGEIKAAFAVLDEVTVLAFVRFEKPPKIDVATVLSDRTKVEITSSIADPDICDEEGSQRIQPFSGTGLLVPNRMGVKADFTVSLTSRTPALYLAATPFDAKMLRWGAAKASVIEDRSLAEREIKGVSGLCCPDSTNPHRRFQRIFLAENLAAEKPEAWLRDVVKCPQEKINQSIKTVLQKMESNGRKLNAEQESILKNVQLSQHSTDVIRGPPGCGKTTLIAAIAEHLIRCSEDIGIFMCAPSNGNTQRMWEAATEVISVKKPILSNDTNDYAPQRVYRAHLEEEYLFERSDKLGKDIKAHNDRKQTAAFADHFKRPEATWYAGLAEADRKRDMSDPSKGLTAEVLDFVHKNPHASIIGKIGHSHRNAVLVFQNGLERLSQEAFEKWKGYHRGQFKDAWRVIAQHIVGRKHVVNCTIGNLTSRLMRKVLENFKCAVLMIDEVSLTTDPALCNALVNVVDHMRIRNKFGGQSPIVKLILIGDEAQGYPLVKSEKEGLNYFGEQLALSPYERLVHAGADVQDMTEQFRMVPALCRLPNMRGYGGQLRCSAERRQHRLPEGKAKLLQDFFKVNFDDCPKVVSAVDKDQAKDDHLRLLLASVPAGKCQIEPATKSRLNHANVEVTMRIFKELVSSLCPMLLSLT
jgi:energy-coupling factor transporter ATP-binding protein EcfA2